MLLTKKVEAEAARIKAEYAEKEAELREEKAALELDIAVLSKKKQVKHVGAEVKISENFQAEHSLKETCSNSDVNSIQLDFPTVKTEEKGARKSIVDDNNYIPDVKANSVLADNWCKYL